MDLRIEMPESEKQALFEIHYEHCGEEWTDYWSCACNDRCPKCNREIEPYHFEVLAN